MSLHGGSSASYLYALRGNPDKRVGLPTALCCPAVPAPCTCSAGPSLSLSISISSSLSLSLSLSVIVAIKRRFVNADAETSRYPWPKLCGQLANWWFDLPIEVVIQHSATRLHKQYKTRIHSRESKQIYLLCSVIYS